MRILYVVGKPVALEVYGLGGGVVQLYPVRTAKLLVHQRI